MSGKCLRSLELAIPVLLLLGCGGGSTQDTVVLTGVFLDSAVGGLKYDTATRSDFTTADGEFKYIQGETVTFSIGNIILPPAVASSVMTPMTLIGTTETDTTNPAVVNLAQPVVNLAQLLQTLDADPLTDGITITEATHTLFAGDVDVTPLMEWDSPTYDEDAQLVLSVLDPTMTLVTEEDAVAELQQTVSDLGNSVEKTISLAGRWDKTETYDICPGLTVHYSTDTITYANGVYESTEVYRDDIGTFACTVVDNPQVDEYESFTGDAELDAAQLKAMFDNDEIQEIVINSPDEFTVTMLFNSGGTDVTVTQVWTKYTTSLDGTWDKTESFDVCPGLTVDYSTDTIVFTDGVYYSMEDFHNEISVNTATCSSVENLDPDEEQIFMGTAQMNSAELLDALNDSEFRSIVINSPDKFTVTGAFDAVVTFSQVWTRQAQ